MELYASLHCLDPIRKYDEVIPIESIVRFSSSISRLGWEVFHRTNRVRFPPTYLTSLRFSSSVSHWVRRFFIDGSRIVLIVPAGLGAWYSGILFFLLTCLSVGRFLHPFHEPIPNIVDGSYAQRSSRLRRKAIVMSWPRDPVTWSRSSSYLTRFH